VRVINSLTEEFDAIPKAVLTLIDIATVKLKAVEADAIKLQVSLNSCRLTLKNLESLRDGKITKRLNEFKGKVTLTFDERPVLVFNVLGGKPEEEIRAVIDFLSFEE
jgi:transcription-repair coupling factor (superfamily II helicase)